MRSFVVAVAVFACACGDVLKVPDAGPIDAFVPDSPPGPTCQASEMLCGATCANLMSNDLYCGNCNTQCSPTQGCFNGSCVDKASKCASIRLWNPAAPDGVYFNPNTGTEMYCDFTNNMTYDEFKMARFDSAPTGLTVMRAGEFANAGFQKAFIGMYNELKGVRAAYSFNPTNCCVTTIAGLRLYVNGSVTFAGVAGATSCTFAYTQGLIYGFTANLGLGIPATLPADFFTVNPPSEAANCADGANPAFYYKRHAGLN
jgi:hypothetical protein